MSLMAFMEMMSTSNMVYVASFFIGVMMAISPCPMATNITAIAYVSKKIDNSKHTLSVGFLYTLGRMFTYTLIASLIVWFSINTQTIALLLQKYGAFFLGPLLLFMGVLMLDIIKFNFLNNSERFNNLKEWFASRGYMGSFFLGVLFALAFCPFSAVLFFGMLIPLALKTGSAIIVPSIFAFATGLPVIIFSLILVKSISKLGGIMSKVQTIEKWVRKTVAVIFIIVGLYYTGVMVV